MLATSSVLETGGKIIGYAGAAISGYVALRASQTEYAACMQLKVK
jgi:hypothetical protein